MDPKSRQAALDNISPEDLAKIEAHQAKTKGAFPVDEEWLLLAEFAEAFGWQAYLDAKNDRKDENGNLLVNTAEMMTLLEAHRKLEHMRMFRNAQAAFIGAGSAQTKKPSQTFKSLVKDILSKAKADA